MKMTTRKSIHALAGLALGICLVASASAQVIIDDDLNDVGDSASYTEVALGTDHEVIWGFDYSGIVGPAPNTTDASTTGVRITANRTAGLDSAATLFHNTPVPANAKVTVDLYMGVTGTGGTTEYGSVGLGSTGTTAFSIFSPIQGDGTYMTHSGDGDSASDWRWSRPSGVDPSVAVPVNSVSPTYLLGSSDDDFYDTCCGLIQDPVGGRNPGTGSNQWVTLEVQTLNGTTSISINGTPVVFGPSVGEADDTMTGGSAPGGFASFSYADVFGSVASPGRFAVWHLRQLPSRTCSRAGIDDADGSRYGWPRRLGSTTSLERLAAGAASTAEAALRRLPCYGSGRALSPGPGPFFYDCSANTPCELRATTYCAKTSRQCA